MKNIHILPTDKPSRVFTTKDEGLGFDNQMLENTELDCQNQNIYITSDEEIKEGDWYENNGVIFKADDFFDEGNNPNNSNPRVTDFNNKIIFTTDQDLIKDGVQVIDDEFLEWFVKNPSCEYVDLIGLRKENGYEFLGYEIIIPKELTPEFQEVIDFNDKIYNQETLEEAFEKWAEQFPKGYDKLDVLSFGAVWQQKQDKNKYSEEEVLDLLTELSNDIDALYRHNFNEKEWFEQFKKK